MLNVTIFFIVMLNVVMRSVIMLSVVAAIFRHSPGVSRRGKKY